MSQKRIRHPKPKFKRRELKLDELEAILERTKSGPINEEEYDKLKGAVDTLAFLTQELEARGVSIRRLRNLIFGARTEKTRQVLGDHPPDDGSDSNETTGSDEESKVASESGDSQGTEETGAAEVGNPKEAKKRKGHGRNGADKYTGAKKVAVAHETLKSGDQCPECDKGKVYQMKEPAVIVRVTGVAPIDATVYELMRLRCNLCGEIFTAPAPAGIGEEKYDEKAAAMIALLKYGCGFPFNRMARLEANLGIPLAASTQWEVVAPMAAKMVPVYRELVRQAAQGELLHNDDTIARILDLEGGKKAKYVFYDEDDGLGPKRTGIYTTGIVSVAGGRRIALFFTGRKHAGENLADVLKERSAELGAPIQMSDGLAANTAGDFETIEGNCNSHARRKFVEVVEDFPDEVSYVLETYEAVYANEDETKKQKMSAAKRLVYHQERSGPLMNLLEEWLREQIEENKVEPNSSIGEAIKYMRKRWDKLTLFLRVAGAAIDNNICERALKKAILNRKNAMFFKTPNGAYVADLFMSLIHTTELYGGNAFEYLVALQKNSHLIAKDPSGWMPWNYRETLALLKESEEDTTK